MKLDVFPINSCCVTYAGCPRLRWRTAARAVHAGYNVLLMDTDVLLLDDPYKFWKKPPFNQYQILSQV